MSNALVARRYAQAVFDIAKEANQIDQWLDDLETICKVFKEPKVIGFFDNPDISFKKKQDVLAESLQQLNPLALNLVYLLMQRRRVRSIGEITSEYRAMVNQLQGVESADVTTAVPLEAAQADRVIKQLEAITRKKIVLKQKVDPSVIGGLVTRVGDKMIDGSLKTRLESLRLYLK